MDSKFFPDLSYECDKYLFDLHTSASIGCDERVRDIIENSENKAVVNEQNKMNWTPLMYAACCANLKVVLLLLEEGADTELKNNQGHTALMLASKCGSTDVVSLLIDAGANINEQDKHGWSALFYAAAFGHRSVALLLMEKGANFDAVDMNDRITPLMLASAAGHEMIVKDLLQFGANPDLKSNSGETADSLAVKNRHIRVKKLIDAYNYSRRQSGEQKLQAYDLQSLLKHLKLSKYYYMFETHGIDIDTFWLLKDEDLKEIGIQLLGPRKKLHVAIAQWHQDYSISRNMKENPYANKLLVENHQLKQQLAELKFLLSQEKELRTAAEQNLADGLQTLKNFTDTVQCTIGHTIHLQDKLKENHASLVRLLCASTQSLGINSYRSRPNKDVIFQLIDCMGKLIDDVHNQTVLCLTKSDFKH